MIKNRLNARSLDDLQDPPDDGLTREQWLERELARLRRPGCSPTRPTTGNLSNLQWLASMGNKTAKKALAQAR